MSVTWETPAWAHQEESVMRRSWLAGMGGPALGAIAGAAAVAVLVFMFYEPAPRAAVPESLAPVNTAPAEPAARAIPAVLKTAVAELDGPAELPAGSARFTVARPASASADSPVPFHVAAAADAPAVDNAPTGSLVPVAETESEVVSLESQFAAEGDGDFSMPAADEASTAGDVAAVPVAIAEPGMTAARTAKWVNLRSSPDNDSEVIAVVPYDAEIMAEENCPHWCSVIYQGKQGYIYKSFVTRPVTG